MRVLVAGAGPTGLTLGIDLARRGIDVVIVDKAERHFAGSRGDTLQPRTLEVFEDLGVLDAVLAAGSPVPATRVHLDGVHVMDRWMAEPVAPSPGVPHPNPWCLGQAQTEAVLREHLAGLGVRVRLGAALTGLTQNEKGVTARLSTGETVRAAYLVGADGASSTVRKALGIAFPGTTDEAMRMLIADVAADDLDHAWAHWFAHASEPTHGVHLSPLPGTGRLFQFHAPLPEAVSDASLDTLQHVLDGFTRGVRLDRLTWSSIWRPNIRLAERYRVGRVFLAGDAAHAHPPTGGQGLNTGVQDAYNLGWKLADGSAALLDSYETERRATAERVLDLSTELLRRHKDGAEDAHERDETTRQLDITYRAPSPARVCAGDRAPDAPVTDRDGKDIRLFDIYRGPHATRLTFGGPAPDEPHAWAVLRPGETVPGPYVTDTGGHAHAAYDASAGTEVVIRPDGHIGRHSADRTGT
ncbi:FAD-dependent monooxygenase [Streptomyces sp. NPDC100445]|uniref:FAD-dependent monooxygenase n=1 Tax=Streptomyces sp. NPDC100445 TaxID=3366102 RepID=UPI003829CC55